MLKQLLSGLGIILISYSPIHAGQTRVEQKLEDKGSIMPKKIHPKEKDWNKDEEWESEFAEDRWKEGKQHTKFKKNLEAELKAGEITNKLMGKPFSHGFYMELNGDGKIKVYPELRAGIDSRIRIESQDYKVGSGGITNFDMDISGRLEAFLHESKACNATLGFGLNFDAYTSLQKFEDLTISAHNVTIGPEISFELDSKYFDFNFVLAAGFGKAGNDVHGSSTDIKPKAKTEIALELNPIRIEGYAEAEANFWNTENNSRNDYTISAGAEIEYELFDNVSITGKYERRWLFGNQDNLSSDITAAGIKVEY